MKPRLLLALVPLVALAACTPGSGVPTDVDPPLPTPTPTSASRTSATTVPQPNTTLTRRGPLGQCLDDVPFCFRYPDDLKLMPVTDSKGRKGYAVSADTDLIVTVVADPDAMPAGPCPDAPRDESQVVFAAPLSDLTGVAEGEGRGAAHVVQAVIHQAGQGYRPLTMITQSPSLTTPGPVPGCQILAGQGVRLVEGWTVYMTAEPLPWRDTADEVVAQLKDERQKAGMFIMRSASHRWASSGVNTRRKRRENRFRLIVRPNRCYRGRTLRRKP